jgi:hypothetical protein
MFDCVICKVNTSTVSNYRKHLISKTHISNLEALNITKDSLSNAKSHEANNSIIIPPSSVLDVPTSDSQINQDNQLEIPPNKTSKNMCKCCNKSFASGFSLKRHIPKCSNVQILLSDVGNVSAIADYFKKSNDQQPSNVTIIVNNNTINNTLNGDLNITVGNPSQDEIYDNFINYWKIMGSNPFGFEDTKMLEDKNIYNDVHASGLKAYKAYIKHVYSNTANHNVALYNKREKLCKYLNSKGEISIVSLDSILIEMVMNNLDSLDAFLDRKDIPIKPQYKKMIDKLKEIHMLDGVNPYLKEYIAEMRIVLLNTSDSALKNIQKFHEGMEKYTLEHGEQKIIVPSTDKRINF